MFELHFESVYTPLSKMTIHIYTSNSEINLNKCVFSITEIFKALKTLFDGCKSEPDLIPEIIYHNFHYTLSHLIHYLFTLSLSTGCYPNKWKSS